LKESLDPRALALGLQLALNLANSWQISRSNLEVGQMKTDVAAKDCWIVGQLAGIRMLEHELSDEFKRPSERASEDLRRQVEELKAWLNLVDDALTVRISLP